MSIRQLISNSRKLFLIDSMGALISALLYGLLLANLVDIFGMPQMILYYLSFLAGVYAVYSGLCFLLKPKNWRPFLKIIAFANLLHCILTLGLLGIYRQEITTLGLAYFIGEIIVVVCLAIIELQVASRKVL